jgi:hypothetical protein
MNKIVGLVIILAFIWAIPSLRGRFSAAAVPVLERLGPVGDFAINPLRRHAAKSKATHLHRVLSSDRDIGRAPPDERDFHVWVQSRIPGEDGLDPWGNPYWVRRSIGSMTVGSNGADGRRGNDDDVVFTAPF